jgi:hypothetical protein
MTDQATRTTEELIAAELSTRSFALAKALSDLMRMHHYGHEHLVVGAEGRLADALFDFKRSPS